MAKLVSKTYGDALFDLAVEEHKEQTLYDEEVEEYVKTYSSMKPKEAAAIFDTMKDDLKLVAKILMSMDAQSRADILGKMNSEIAAKVTEIMEP